MNIISNGNNIYTVTDLYKHLLYLAFKQTKISRYVRYINTASIHYLSHSRSALSSRIKKIFIKRSCRRTHYILSIYSQLNDTLKRSIGW